MTGVIDPVDAKYFNGCRFEIPPFVIAKVVAQATCFDARFWLKECTLAGVHVSIAKDELITCFERAETKQATFLLSWLSHSPGGVQAVISQLKQQEALQ